MQPSIAKIAAAFLFVSVAFADLHDSCTCHNGDSYNWRITTKACEVYSSKDYKWGKGTYDTPSGRCTKSGDSDQLAGDQWEAACREVAVAGFQCADGKGRCTADADQVKGWC
ncbi:hypothetical protein ColTof4_03922 [Colletotrichum tofieldiae]|uniref:Uncharacterized protein n=1 Tax=Colletotrichum tofieldiae TaxID=708197 RepID=A0A166XCZ1_9PEZI|nr:hypothetical protein CT0861_11911 [Colletotrichum tofieldiae]GKT66430.1 hypothetical protein ColTof3_13769 [Colletotrichum tofieldiae]GKT71499.1 hypothetical protein ColTof4_03922 [Colletotrichum tofieldiae]GKT95346.1 hypothetical protein Ct61P_13196 [Colletotrichum tofieldiae]